VIEDFLRRRPVVSWAPPFHFAAQSCADFWVNDHQQLRKILSGQ